MSLDQLLGTWNFSMRHVAMTEPVTGRQRYERVLDEAFVLQHVTYEHPEFPDALALLAESSCHYFDVRGVIRVFDLEIRDSGLSMIRRDPDYWQRSAITFRGSNSMEGTGENSHDGGATWQHDFSVTYTRAE